MAEMEVLTLVKSIKLDLVLRKPGQHLELVSANEVEACEEVLSLNHVLK